MFAVPAELHLGREDSDSDNDWTRPRSHSQILRSDSQVWHNIPVKTINPTLTLQRVGARSIVVELRTHVWVIQGSNITQPTVASAVMRS